MRYKKGDKVVIRSDLPPAGTCPTTGLMYSLSVKWNKPGARVTITEVHNSYYNACNSSWLCDSYIDHDKTAAFNKAVDTFKTKAQESNLEKAKRLYPKGTKYKPLGSNFKVGISESPHNDKFTENNIACGAGYIYYKGEWAEIIKDTPEKCEIEVGQTKPDYLKESKKKEVVHKYPVGAVLERVNKKKTHYNTITINRLVSDLRYETNRGNTLSEQYIAANFMVKTTVDRNWDVVTEDYAEFKGIKLPTQKKEKRTHQRAVVFKKSAKKRKLTIITKK